MELGKTVSRDLYMDVTLKEEALSEIYLYCVEFKADKSFRTTEFTFSRPEDIPEDEEKKDIKLEFFDKILEFKCDGIKTHFFAIDADEVMLRLIEPLKAIDGKAKRYFNDVADNALPGEWLTDCISMGRVIAMTTFDEKPELGALIRRRLKEKYHNVSNEVKKERATHLFIKYEKPVTGPELSFRVTDANVNTIDDIRLHGRIEDDIMVAKTLELLNNYPDADIMTDRTSIRIYTLIRSAEALAEQDTKRVIFSISSMLHALGKKSVQASPEAYRDYVLNAEALRFGRYEDNVVVGIHYLTLPIRYNSEKAWKKNFKKNSMWTLKEGTKDEYVLIGDKGEPKKKKAKAKVPESEMYGRLAVEKGNEKFVLKCSDVVVKKYIQGFAIITIGLENHFYPGEKDIQRINDLCSSLWCSSKADDDLPDDMNLQMKNGTKTYSLATVKRSDSGFEPWLGLLLTMGRKKSNKGTNYFGTTTLSEKCYAYFEDGSNCESSGAKQAISMALIKSEYILNLEKDIAATVSSKKTTSFVPMKKSQKKYIKLLNGAYAYMLTSYTYAVENGEYKDIFNRTYKIRKGKETEERLEKKFDLLY